MGYRQDERFCIHKGVRMYERQGLYGAGYQLVLLHTPSPEGVTAHILTVFRGFTKVPATTHRASSLAVCHVYPRGRKEPTGCTHLSSKVCSLRGARAVTDLWGGLCQAHQSLSLRGASDSGQLQAMGLQLGDGGEEGGCRQGGSGEVRGSAALLLVPAEVEGHLLSYRRRPGAPLVLHRCEASKRGEGVTSGIRTGCPALLNRPSLPPCSFLRPALCPPAREVSGEKCLRAAAGWEGH